jgi:hypothetical protein
MAVVITLSRAYKSRRGGIDRKHGIQVDEI